MHRSLAFLALLSACSGSDNKVGSFNTAPSVSLTSPPDGSAYDEGSSITFQAIADDDFDASPALTVSWSSDRDGALEGGTPPDGSGAVEYTTANLTPGNHTITLLVVDSQGESGQDTVGLTINEVPDAPDVVVVHPVDGEPGLEGEDFTFVAKVSDEQDDPTLLTVSFKSDVDGEFCTPTPDAIGVATCDAQLSGGDHVLTYTVTDTSGQTGEATTYFAVTSTEEVDNDGDDWTEEQGDCDDGDSSVNPGADEYYNGRDDDCDGLIDDETAGYDDDGDGYTEIGGDCDDTTTTAHPASP